MNPDIFNEQIKLISEHNLNDKVNLTMVEIKAIEEMSELTQSIMKDGLKNPSSNLIEEVADTIITINQLKYALEKQLGNSNVVNNVIDFKLKRTINRLNIGKEK